MLTSLISYVISIGLISGCGKENGGGLFFFGASECWWSTRILATLRFIWCAGKKKQDILSHYEFRRQIALAWLDPETYWPERRFPKRKSDGDSTQATKRTRLDDETVPTLTRVTRSSVNASAAVAGTAPTEAPKLRKRASRLTNQSLHPTKGLFAMRLRIDPPHMPVAPVCGRPKCVLHKWSTEEIERSKVMLCSVCSIHLCIHCFRTFHVVPDIVEKKEDIILYY